MTTTGNQLGLTLPKFIKKQSVVKETKFPSPLIHQNRDVITPPVVTPQLHPRTPATPILGGRVPLPYQPRTPLVTPKIGLTDYNLRTYTPRPGIDHLRMPEQRPGIDRLRIPQPGLDENPWIPVRNDGPSDVKIAAITPIGTIALVPTADKRPPTPRRFRNPLTPGLAQTPGRHLTLKVIDPKTGVEIADPMLNATIYLDCTKQNDRDYHYVTDRMRAISKNIHELQQQYKNVLKPIPQLTGCVSKRQFEEALSIYENNQVYYQDRIDDHVLDIPTIRTRLTELEHWFMLIIEPKSTDDINAWKNRERSKLTKGISGYCDPELYTYIDPLPPASQALIRQHHVRFGI